MKKFIKTIICLVLICINIGVELYPSGKLLVKRYISALDFQNVSSSEPITKYTSHLSVDEKSEISLFLKTLYQTKN